MKNNMIRHPPHGVWTLRGCWLAPQTIHLDPFGKILQGPARNWRIIPVSKWLLAISDRKSPIWPSHGLYMGVMY